MLIVLTKDMWCAFSGSEASISVVSKTGTHTGKFRVYIKVIKLKLNLI